MGIKTKHIGYKSIEDTYLSVGTILLDRGEIRNETFYNHITEEGHPTTCIKIGNSFERIVCKDNLWVVQ